MRRQRLGFVAAVAVGLAVVLALHTGGCAKTAQGRLNQAEVSYATAAGELNDLRATGRISAETYHASIAPGLRSAYAALKRARVEAKVGSGDAVDAALNELDDALRQLQPFRPAAATATRPTLGPAIPPPAQGLVIDPLTAGLILGGAERLIAAVGKYFRGDTLTPEEEALLVQASDAEAARVDRLDPPPAAPA